MPSKTSGADRGAATLDELAAARAQGRSAKKRAPTKPDRKGADGLIRSDSGQIRACEYNAMQLLAVESRFDELHYDEFLSRVRLGDADWTDADDLEVLTWLQSAHNVANFRLGQATNGVRALAARRRRDSLREFVLSLPPWARETSVALALHQGWGAPDDEVTRAASFNFFVSLIARALRPGAKVDTMMVFEGPQGCGKSRAMRALGGPFHAEITAPVGTPDFMREMMGVWIAELSELDSLRRGEASTIKRLLSALEDRFVQKYALHAESHPRRSVAVATTNERHYWQDHTGARRLIPVACGAIDVGMIERCRLQWFAEAREAFESGATWWEFPTAIAAEQDDRQQIDPWEDAIRGFMRDGKPTASGKADPWPAGWIASAEIMRKWLGIETGQQQQVYSRRLGQVMRRLGYASAKDGSGDVRGWKPEVSDEVSGEVPF